MKHQRDVIYEILKSFPQDGTPIRFNVLRRKVKMSSATLSNGLVSLTKIGFVERKRVPSLKGIGIEYSMDYGLINLYNDIENKCKNINQIIGITDKLILDLFAQYDNTEEDKKEIVFETHLTVIIRFLKLCTSLRKSKNNIKNCESKVN